MKKLRIFCSTLEAFPCLEAVEAEWKHALANDWQWAQQFLRPTGELATAYPKLDQSRRSYSAYRVVCHDEDDDDYVGVCPDGTGNIPLSRKQLAVRQLDRRNLGMKLARVVGLCFDYADIPELRFTSRLGVYERQRGHRCLVYLAIPAQPSDVRATALLLSTLGPSPFLMLVPTKTSERGWPESVAQQGCIAPVEELFALDDEDTLIATATMSSVLESLERSALRGRNHPTKATPHLTGMVRLEDIRAAYPDLTTPQLERVRKELEGWRRTHEDDVMMSQEDPDTGRRRYAYPAAIAEDKIQLVLAREQRRLSGV